MVTERRMTIWERFSVPGQQVLSSLRDLTSRLPGGAPVLVHSDLLRVGVPDGIPAADGQCGRWLELLLDAADGRPLLIPTFNYDYCRTRRFDPQMDDAQVGAFGRYCAARFPSARTGTPVFNFCIFNNDGFSLAPVANPFGASSVFAEFHRRNGAIIFLGVGMIANTFIHYVEERLEIGYRYDKPFPGVVQWDGAPVAVDFHFRVRPRAAGAVEYGLLGEDDMERAGLLRRVPAGLSSAMMVRAEDYMTVVGGAMREDELHVLTPNARAITKSLYDQHGRPLTVAAMEAQP